MLTHPTREQITALGLSGMGKSLEEQCRQPDIEALSFEERLALLVDRELSSARTSGSAAGSSSPACARPQPSRTPT